MAKDLAHVLCYISWGFRWISAMHMSNTYEPWQHPHIDLEKDITLLEHEISQVANFMFIHFQVPC